MKTTKNFEVIINGNFAAPAYTLNVLTAKKAMQIALKEAKLNNNSTIDVIEVDDKGNAIESGFCSGTIKIQ